MGIEDRQEILESEDICSFLNNVTPQLECNLQQNQIIDIFRDDYAQLGDEERLSSQADNTTLQVSFVY